MVGGKRGRAVDGLGCPASCVPSILDTRPELCLINACRLGFIRPIGTASLKPGVEHREAEVEERLRGATGDPNLRYAKAGRCRG